MGNLAEVYFNVSGVMKEHDDLILPKNGVGVFRMDPDGKIKLPLEGPIGRSQIGALPRKNCLEKRLGGLFSEVHE